DRLLNQAGRNVRATRVGWHYRSRFEALISFSNAAFYNGQLVTIPDRALRTRQEPVSPVRSDDETAWQLGVSRLLAAPITTHRIADGLYEDRVNPPEACYIAGLVRELLARKTGQSLGIVAFSEAQQSEIEDALARLAADDTTFATALNEGKNQQENGHIDRIFRQHPADGQY